MNNKCPLTEQERKIGLRSSRVQGHGRPQGLGGFQDASQWSSLGCSVVDMVRLGARLGLGSPSQNPRDMRSPRHGVTLHTESQREPPQIRPPGKAAGQR